MYHFQGVTLLFTKRKWQTYECPVRKTPSLNREGWGGSPPPLGRAAFLTLHRNTLSSNKLRRTVKFFYLMQLFNNTIS